MDFIIRSGNVEKGGSTRARGEEEPGMQKKLTPEELENSKAIEVLSMKELDFLRKFLSSNGLFPKEVLTQPNLMRFVENSLPQGFRFNMLKTHLEKLMNKKQ